MVSKTVKDLKREVQRCKTWSFGDRKKSKGARHGLIKEKASRGIKVQVSPSSASLGNVKNICLLSCITEMITTEDFKWENAIIRLVFATGRRNSMGFLLATLPYGNHCTDCSCKETHVHFLFGAIE